MVVYLVMESGINIIRVLHKNMDVEQQLEQEPVYLGCTYRELAEFVLIIRK